jgi:hypothetical protein
MAISMGMEGTFRFREVIGKSFNAFGVRFIILSAIAHIPLLLLYLWPFVMVRYAPRSWLLYLLLAEYTVYVVGFGCVLIAYGAIMYGVIQDLAGRPVSIAEAIAIAARRSLPQWGVSVAVVALTRLAVPGFSVLLTYWLAIGMYFVAAPVLIAEQAGGWGAYIAIFSVRIVFGAYNAVVAAVFYDSLRLAKDSVHIAKVFD